MACPSPLFSGPALQFHGRSLVTLKPSSKKLTHADTLLSYQPYGKQGLLIADIDITEATGLLAARCKSV